MKKILLLGGSAQQVIAIETAKKLGYYTILCDYLTDNPGQYVADRFYLTSTTDAEAVLEVAKKENVDGVLAYASDPAAPTAAYVAEKLGLPTNPYESVNVLCNKDLFRSFLNENGFASPKAVGFTSVEAAVKGIRQFKLPVVVKPVDSSGSKGVSVVRKKGDVRNAVELAFSFSKGSRVIIEDYLEMKHDYLIGGDIFVYNGEIVQWGLLNCHRDDHVNPLVPIGKSYPVFLEADDVKRIHDTLQGIVDLFQIKAGAMNVELIIDKNNQVCPLDIGPRSGGNMIPDLLSIIFQTDVVEMCVKAAMGEEIDIIEHEETSCFATYNLHADHDGKFAGVQYSERIKPYIVRECVYKNPGDSVQYFDNASKVIGIVFMRFDSSDMMTLMLRDIDKHIIVNLMSEEEKEYV